MLISVFFDKKILLLVINLLNEIHLYQVVISLRCYTRESLINSQKENPLKACFFVINN